MVVASRRELVGGIGERGLRISQTLAVARCAELFPKSPTPIEPCFTEQRTVCVALQRSVKIPARFSKKNGGRRCDFVRLLTISIEKEFAGLQGQHIGRGVVRI